MKRKMAVILLSAALAGSLLAGCSGEVSNEYVTVKQYKGLEVPQVTEEEVTDDQVEQQIQSALSADMVKTPITDRAAQSGDWVNIDYTGYVDGEAFDGGSAEGAPLELGSGSFIGATDDYKGFEEQIEGHNTGDEFDITVQFPETYANNPAMAGVVAQFHIVLNEIYTQTVPELTDEWVAENSEDSDTVDEYREEVRKQLEENAEETVKSQLQTGVQDALLAQSEMKEYPKGAVDEQIEQANQYYTSIAGMYGLELSDFITTYLQTTEEDFNSSVETAAQQTVQLDEAMKLIAEKENLEPTEKEYEEEIAQLAEDAGADDVDSFKEQYGEEELKAFVLRQNVLDYLVDNCVQVEDSGDSE